MMIIGCDFHPSWQQVCWLDTETGETGERKLVHAAGDATVQTDVPFTEIEPAEAAKFVPMRVTTVPPAVAAPA